MAAVCPQDTRELKRAMGRLIKSLGGEKVAADITGRSTSQVQRWTSAHHPDFPNVACLAELEGNAPEPVVSATLARLRGGVFVPLPTDDLREPGAMADHVMEMVAQVGELTALVRAALSDGVVCREEVRRLRPLLGDLIASGAAFDRMLAGIEEG